MINFENSTGHEVHDSAGVLLKPLEDQEYFELSFKQREYLYDLDLSNYSESHNMIKYYPFKDIDPDIFLKAFDHLVQENEILRTSYLVKENRIRQKIHYSKDFNYSIEELDFSKHSDMRAKIGEVFNSLAKDRLNLVDDGVFKGVLCKMGSTSYLFFLVIHHSIFDEYSLEKLAMEFERNYGLLISGMEEKLIKKHIQYKDYEIWRQYQFQSEKGKKIKKYWSDTLPLNSEITNYLSIFESYGGNYPDQWSGVIRENKSAYDLIHSGKVQVFRKKLDDEIKNDLLDLADKFNASLYCILMAAFNLLFIKFCKQYEILFTMPIVEHDIPDQDNLLGNLTGSTHLYNKFHPNQKVSDVINITRDVFFDSTENVINNYFELGIPFDFKGATTLFINYNPEKRSYDESDVKFSNPEMGWSIVALECAITNLNKGLYFKWNHNLEFFNTTMMEDLTYCHFNIMKNLKHQLNWNVCDL